MRRIILVLLVTAIPLCIVGADLHAASKLSRYTQIKVCLTSIGWCSDYMKRTPESSSCVCRNHQQNPGHVTSLLGVRAGVPEID